MYRSAQTQQQQAHSSCSKAQRHDKSHLSKTVSVVSATKLVVTQLRYVAPCAQGHPNRQQSPTAPGGPTGPNGTRHGKAVIWREGK